MEIVKKFPFFLKKINIPNQDLRFEDTLLGYRKVPTSLLNQGHHLDNLRTLNFFRR